MHTAPTQTDYSTQSNRRLAHSGLTHPCLSATRQPPQLQHKARLIGESPNKVTNINILRQNLDPIRLRPLRLLSLKRPHPRSKFLLK